MLGYDSGKDFVALIVDANGPEVIREWGAGLIGDGYDVGVIDERERGFALPERLDELSMAFCNKGPSFFCKTRH